MINQCRPAEHKPVVFETSVARKPPSRCTPTGSRTCATRQVVPVSGSTGATRRELFAHFATFSVYRRRRLLDHDHAKRIVLGVLYEELQARNGVGVGYVIMPDHVHAIVGETKGVRNRIMFLGPDTFYSPNFSLTVRPSVGILSQVNCWPCSRMITFTCKN